MSQRFVNDSLSRGVAPLVSPLNELTAVLLAWDGFSALFLSLTKY